MNKNTLCERCYFSDVATSSQSCVFGIPEAITAKKTISITNDYNVIHNYTCRYGVSKDTANNKLNNIDIQEYAKNRVAPVYMLYVIVKLNDDFQSICNNIMNIKILPKAISIVLPLNYDNSQIQKICEQTFKKAFSWKLHIPTGDKTEYQNIKMLLSTDTRINNIDYIFFVDSKTLNYVADTDRINKINYILNIDQPDLGALGTSKSINNFYGLFITVDNVKGIYLTDDRIGDIIYEKFKDAVTNYD